MYNKKPPFEITNAILDAVAEMKVIRIPILQIQVKNPISLLKHPKITFHSLNTRPHITELYTKRDCSLQLPKR